MDVKRCPHETYQFHPGHIADANHRIARQRRVSKTTQRVLPRVCLITVFGTLGRARQIAAKLRNAVRFTWPQVHP